MISAWEATGAGKANFKRVSWSAGTEGSGMVGGAIGGGARGMEEGTGAVVGRGVEAAINSVEAGAGRTVCWRCTETLATAVPEIDTSI